MQKLYAIHLQDGFLINRRYQRKLVWSIEEKRAFINSLVNGFPVPLFLLAESEHQGVDVLEIIDGLQRLNAIFSFLEGEFDVDGGYFDLATIPETSSRQRKGELAQNTPTMKPENCSSVVTYTVPLSIYRNQNEDQIDEVFRRINSNGKHLSRQELRQAGSTGHFADAVRGIATSIRGDTSSSDRLILSAMKEISITNKELDYGINVDNLFWVKNGILTREMVRQSRDEELISDTLAYAVLTPKPPSNSTVLDQYFGISTTSDGQERYEAAESAVQKLGRKKVHSRYIKAFEVLRRALIEVDTPFNQLLFGSSASARMPRYFQVFFLAVYEMVAQDKLVPRSYSRVANKLRGAGSSVNISEGGNWSATERERSVDAVKGILRTAFKKRGTADAAIDSWVTELENILAQSKTEGALYDFKQGLMTLSAKPKWNSAVPEKIGKTLAAMANHGPGSTGYVVVGVSDSKATSTRIQKLRKVSPATFRGFDIFGVDHEAKDMKKGIDGWFQRAMQAIKGLPMTEAHRSQISRDAMLVDYQGRSVLVFRVESTDEPCLYDGGYYERHGANVEEVRGDALRQLFGRFYKDDLDESD